MLAPGGEPAGEEWLRYRLGFFYDATYPSVISQSVDDFTWLVLFDDRCSDEFREDIESIAEDVFTPVWSHELFRRDSFAEPVAAIADAPFLITTRIDSDDAMAVDFMATVQAQFARQDRLFVSITRGVQIDRSGAVYLSDQLSNPFLSLIERREPERLPDTVYVAKHARARAHGPDPRGTGAGDVGAGRARPQPLQHRQRPARGSGRGGRTLPVRPGVRRRHRGP